MLNKDEELQLQWIIEELGTESLLEVSDQKWVVSNLKEVNNELKDLKENHNRLDMMLADALQVIEDAGIMSEYLKFRNQ